MGGGLVRMDESCSYLRGKVAQSLGVGFRGIDHGERETGSDNHEHDYALGESGTGTAGDKDHS